MSKTCIITGANSGIGIETAKKLAKDEYKIILAVRNEEKGKAAETPCFLATSEEALLKNGGYWEKKKLKKLIIPENASQIAEKLWKVSKAYVGL